MNVCFFIFLNLIAFKEELNFSILQKKSPYFIIKNKVIFGQILVDISFT